jgi:hypothetical protein
MDAQKPRISPACGSATELSLDTEPDTSLSDSVSDPLARSPRLAASAAGSTRHVRGEQR